MKTNFINIFFSNFLLKWLGLTLWITKPIKLISSEYFISLLRDYELYFKNICSINTKCGYPTYWDFDRYFRSHSWYIKKIYIPWSSRDIYYSIDSHYENNKSHSCPVQYVLTLKTYQLEVTTSMIKTNHLGWYVIIFADETPNFITDYELNSKFTKNL